MKDLKNREAIMIVYQYANWHNWLITKTDFGDFYNPRGLCLEKVAVWKIRLK